MLIRPARASDSAAIARVHVKSWQSTYRGIFPEEFLATLSIEKRREMWEDTIADPTLGQSRFLFVLENDRNEVVGFISGGPNRAGPPEIAAELYAIYLLDSAQRSGQGRKLTSRLAEALFVAGFDSLQVWVAAENPSRDFYEHLGGQENSRKIVEILGISVEEIGYAWSDIRSLL